MDCSDMKPWRWDGCRDDQATKKPQVGDTCDRGTNSSLGMKGYAIKWGRWPTAQDAAKADE
jgi:hypothetical protein